jgi:hypothetical protein
MRFSIGVNYWPRSCAYAMWTRFDPAEIAEDFGRIAKLGLDTVRLFLRWDTFQPQPDRGDPRMLERLESVAGLAAAAGLRIMPVLFCGYMDGVALLPDWASDGGAPGNLYAGALLDAQLRFAHAAGERLRAHPALFAWDIGHAFSSVRAPSRAKVRSGEHSSAPAEEQVVADWSRRLAAALRETSAAQVTAGTQSADLTEDRNIRLGSLCTPFDFASMQGSTVSLAFARSRLDAESIAFLAMLAAGFALRPVLVSGFGNPTCPPEKFSAVERFAQPGDPPQLSISPDDPVFATYPCLTEAENARFCADVLERLHADGRLGAYWWCWADYPPDAVAGFAIGPHARSAGIVRADGSERPVAAALADFAGQKRSVVAVRDMPTIASAYYYRTLPSSTRTLYDAFLRHVEPRRRAAASDRASRR